MSSASAFAVGVAPRAILLERLHRDPVEIAAKQRAELAARGLRLCATSSTPGRAAFTRVLGRGASVSRIVRRIPSRSCFAERLAVERQPADQQFVEQHAERIDVAARVDVRPSSPPAPGSCTPACRRACPAR